MRYIPLTLCFAAMILSLVSDGCQSTDADECSHREKYDLVGSQFEGEAVSSEGQIIGSFATCYFEIEADQDTMVVLENIKGAEKAALAAVSTATAAFIDVAAGHRDNASLIGSSL